MVKNKKMSKTSIAVIVLALLLVFSLVMGMTGAWFTDRAAPESEKSVTFGTINIDVNETNFGVYRGATSIATGEVMPGDHIKVNLTVAKHAETDEDFYYVVKIVATVDSTAVGGAGANAWVGKTATTAFASTDAVPSLDFELDGTVYDNDFQGDTIVVSYEVRAIQTANLSAGQAWTALTSGEYAAAENYDFNA